MNVGDLEKKLKSIKDKNTIILVAQYSDYGVLDSCEFIKAVPKGDDNKIDYVMRSHLTMSEGNKQKEKTFLYLGV